jgi:hypothetical protein
VPHDSLTSKREEIIARTKSKVAAKDAERTSDDMSAREQGRSLAETHEASTIETRETIEVAHHNAKS